MFYEGTRNHEFIYISYFLGNNILKYLYVEFQCGRGVLGCAACSVVAQFLTWCFVSVCPFRIYRSVRVNDNISIFDGEVGEAQ